MLDVEVGTAFAEVGTELDAGAGAAEEVKASNICLRS